MSSSTSKSGAKKAAAAQEEIKKAVAPKKAAAIAQAAIAADPAVKKEGSKKPATSVAVDSKAYSSTGKGGKKGDVKAEETAEAEMEIDVIKLTPDTPKKAAKNEKQQPEKKQGKQEKKEAPHHPEAPNKGEKKVTEEPTPKPAKAVKRQAAEENEDEDVDVTTVPESRKKTARVESAEKSDGEEEEEKDEGAADDGALFSISRAPSAKRKALANPQRTLLLTSRGTGSQMRHTMSDLHKLLPHAVKESKFETKKALSLLNELAEMQNCNNAMYFEAHKKGDTYLWLSKTPTGPSIRFHVENIVTSNEVKLTGNCIKGSRPILSFDPVFDTQPQLALAKELLVQAIGTPRGHKRSKPFFDHVMTFSVLDDRIWVRNYQFLEMANETGEASVRVEEIGPRFTLNILRVFEGSFGGPTLFENPNFFSLAARKAEAKSQQRYKNRQRAEAAAKARAQSNTMIPDPMADVFKGPAAAAAAKKKEKKEKNHAVAAAASSSSPNEDDE